MAVKLEELYEPDVVRQIKNGMVELPCAQHLYGLEVDDPDKSSWPGCPECGCMLSLDYCWLCGAWTLHFGGQEFDDTIRDASGTASGDLMCARCAREYAEDEEQESYGDSGEWESS